MYRIMIVLLCFLLTTGSALAEQLKFAQITDVHYKQAGANYGARDVENSGQYLEKAVESLNGIQDLDFVVFSGDNIDDYSKNDLIGFLGITKGLKKPYYVAIGNHDSNINDLNKKEYFSVVSKYNKNQKMPNSYYYFLPNKEFVVVVIDGVGLHPSSHGYYPEEELDWLKETLAKFSNRKAIIVQHFPTVEPYERKSHSVIDPEEYINLLSESKNVIAVISGHYHADGLNEDDNGIEHISTSALVQSPHEYRVVTINYDKKMLLNGNQRGYTIETQLFNLGE
jgi:3',5'-cyclic AMP phosphodiesterase CpdA